MKPLSELIQEKNIQLDTLDPITREGFTQVPNFILRDPSLSLGAKVTYATRSILIAKQSPHSAAYGQEPNYTCGGNRFRYERPSHQADSLRVSSSAFRTVTDSLLAEYGFCKKWNSAAISNV